MAMLGEKYPEAQFAITGVLGPGSNAHGPNEFLHIPTGKKLTAALALLLRDHATQRVTRERDRRVDFPVPHERDRVGPRQRVRVRGSGDGVVDHLRLR